MAWQGRIRYPRSQRTQPIYPGYLRIPPSSPGAPSPYPPMLTEFTPTGKDQTAQIQAGLTAAPDLSIVKFDPGTYIISSPLTVLDKRLNIFGYGASLAWQGTAGTVLTVGFSPSSPLASGTLGADWLVEGLTITETAQHEPIVNNDSVGLCVQNVYAGRFRDLDILGFGTGLSVIGNGTGCVYNRYEMRTMESNLTSLKIRTSNGGFVSENTFVGGRWQYSNLATGLAGKHVDIAGPNVSGIRFNDCSFEALPGFTWATVLQASYCYWLNNRYESTDLSKLPFTVDSTCSKIFLLGGIDADTLVTWQDGSGGTAGNLYLPLWH